ncbi:HAD family hydrolase, partial [Candidatus Falkowbacteria bacterium]|nr:HAD family hydrolase [Candidatus Falkowbacteria bacterium]
ILSKLKAKKTDVLYCGDSGNDLLPLVSGYYGVLVKNASSQVKQDLNRLAEHKNLSKKIYIAGGNFQDLNGNYVSGIIEGAYHFGFFK